MGGCVKDLQAMRGLFPEFDKDIDCPQWLAEEQEYLSSLQHEPKSEALKIEYLEAIEHLESAEYIPFYPLFLVYQTKAEIFG